VWGVASSLVGEILVVIGVQLNGFASGPGSVTWAIAAIAFAAFAISLLMIVATDEIEEEASIEE
jgi:hypothetical protein